MTSHFEVLDGHVQNRGFAPSGHRTTSMVIKIIAIPSGDKCLCLKIESKESKMVAVFTPDRTTDFDIRHRIVPPSLKFSKHAISLIRYGIMQNG